MPASDLSLSAFCANLMELSHRRMKQAIDGLTDEQLFYQPAPGSNSIGWLIWHMSRWKDIQTARATGETQVWLTDGWPARFGLPETADGNGDTPEQAASFRADRALLVEHADAVQEAALRRVREAGDETLSREIESLRPGGQARPAWFSLLINTIDFTEHTGQINYLRGMITGPGWM